MYFLEIETPDGTRRIQLTRDRISIGRLSYNDVVLPSAQISRQHAEMRLINGDWWIADLHSTNGLHLNAQRIQEHRLVPGDCVLLAPGISIRFLSDAPPPLPTSMPAMPPWRALSHELPARQDPPPTVSAGPVIPPDAEWLDAITGRPVSDNMPSPSDVAGSPAPAKHVATGDELRDPYRRSLASDDRHRVTQRPAPTHLHVCQTCGQLTAPDAVYCQNCQQPIAYECPRCRLSLLPIQERCPRCQTPNPGAVRRSRRPTGS